MKKAMTWFLSAFVVGARRPYNSSDSRITILTNTLIFWAFMSLPPLISTLESAGVGPNIYAIPYTVLLIAVILAYLFNCYGHTRWARIIVVLLMNFIGYQAAFLYGKSFNGYLIFFPTIFYTVIALSKEPRKILIPSLLFTLLGLPLIDWLHMQGLVPVTGLNSSNFKVSILWIDTFFITTFCAVMIMIEKSFYDKYEDELENLNQNLENIVQHRTQLLVEAKEEAINASLLKSQFVANTSHELRTPVQGLMGFVSLTERRILKMSGLSEENTISKEKALKSLKSAELSSQRLLNLIDTLLKITKAESKEFLPHPTEFSFSKLVSTVSEEIIANYSDRKLEICGIDVDVVVYSDATLIAQVITNLISNAIKYSYPNTVVTVAVSFDEYQCQLKTINKGPGVPVSEREKIFEPFVQSSRTDKKIGGTGLGLSLCRKYARALQGHVFLLDGSPEATEFIFDFPRQL